MAPPRTPASDKGRATERPDGTMRIEVLRPRVDALTTGDPLDERTKVGPLVRETEGIRVDEWVREAVGSGARLVTGGRRQGAIYAPTVVADVKPEMRISCDELFGPAVAVTPFDDIDEAIALANDSSCGVAAWARRTEWWPGFRMIASCAISARTLRWPPWRRSSSAISMTRWPSGCDSRLDSGGCRSSRRRGASSPRARSRAGPRSQREPPAFAPGNARTVPEGSP